MPMDMHACKSNNVAQFGYDYATKTLAVQFKSGGIYHYFDVEPSKFDGLKTCESVTSYLNQHIKRNHRFERIETRREPQS